VDRASRLVHVPVGGERGESFVATADRTEHDRRETDARMSARRPSTIRSRPALLPPVTGVPACCSTFAPLGCIILNDEPNLLPIQPRPERSASPLWPGPPEVLSVYCGAASPVSDVMSPMVMVLAVTPGVAAVGRRHAHSYGSHHAARGAPRASSVINR
jgi:hypothetical protein